jgi:tetratricopeptide (TPR) repeat protein
MTAPLRHCIINRTAFTWRCSGEGRLAMEAQSPTQPEIAALLTTAEAQLSQGQAAQALVSLQQALGKAQASGDPGVAAQVTFQLAVVRAAAGEAGEALAAMRQASDLFGQAGDQASQIRAQIQVASLEAGLGQVDAAKSVLGSCIDSARQLGDNELQSEAHCALGELLLATRYAAAAADEFRAGLATATGLPDATAQVKLRAFLAVAVFQCGNAAEALSLLAEDAKIAQAMPDGIAGATALSAVSDAAVAIQRPLDALNVGKQVLARLQQTGNQPLIVQAMIGLSNQYALAGQLAGAAQQASQAVAAASQLGGPAAAASASMRLGMMALQRSDRVTAASQLRQARTLLAAAGLPEPPMMTQMIGQLGP